MQKETQTSVVICFIHRDDNQASDFLGGRVANIDFYFDYQGRFFFVMLFKAFIASWRLPEADIYLVEGGLAFWVAFFKKNRKRKRKIVLMAIDALFNWRVRGKVKNYFLKQAFRALDAVLPVSSMVARDCRYYNPTVPMYNVSHYVDVEKFIFLQPDYTKKHILFIINRPRETGETKGLDVVFEIFKLLREKDRDWHLYIIGEGLEKLMVKDPHIHCEGYQNPAEYFTHCSILLVPARYEASSRAAIEAACAGVIPLISSTTGAREFLEIVDKNLLTSYTDVEIFVNKILEYHELSGDYVHELAGKLRSGAAVYDRTRSVEEMKGAFYKIIKNNL